MFVKYFIKTQERPIGMKYNALTSVFVIGGHETLAEDIGSIAKDYFGIDLAQKEVICSTSANNKIRYQCRVDYDTYFVGLQRLKESGVSIVKTNSLWRVMR